MNRDRSLRSVAAGLLCAALAACASYGRPLFEIAPEINATLYTGPTLIEPGDVLDLRFVRKPEWNQIAQVRADGRISFPVVGELRAAGKTIAELDRQLVATYGQVLEDPSLLLNVGGDRGGEGRDSPQAITISGEVRTPGGLTIVGERITLIEAIGRAGGHLKDTALLGNTLMMRRSPTTGLYASWRIDAREDHWEKSQPVYLQRHDIIVVPNTPIDNVNIWVDQYINKMIPTGLTTFALGIFVADR
ncbi:MAG TPA: polysaccharide biosynthesis/export family protein [Planctomycetota bacterium]